MKKMMFIGLAFLLVGSFLAIAQNSVEEKECGFWCQVGKVLWGEPEKRAVVGEPFFTTEATPSPEQLKNLRYDQEAFEKEPETPPTPAQGKPAWGMGTPFARSNIQIPYSEYENIFNIVSASTPEGFTISGMKGSYRYDDARGVLLFEEQPVSYTAETRTVGDQVYIRTPRGYHDQPLHQETYREYGNVIDPNNIQGRTFNFKGGTGSLTAFGEGGFRVESVTNTIPSGEIHTSTIYLPNGETIEFDGTVSNMFELDQKKVRYAGEEGIFRVVAGDPLGEGVLRIKREKTETVFLQTDSGFVKSTTEGEDESIETFDPKTGEIEREHLEDDKLLSWSRYDREGNQIMNAEINSEGGIEQANHYDAAGRLTAVSFYTDGDKTEPETRIGVIDTDTVFIDEDRDGVQDAGELSIPEDELANYHFLAQQARKALSSKEWDAALHGETDIHQAAQRFFQGPSAMGLTLQWEGYRDWVTQVDRFFSANYLGIEPFSSLVCENMFNIEIEEPEGVALIETQSGTWQAVAHIEGEKSPAGPLPCNQEAEEDEEICPEELECRRDGFCYKEGADTPETAFLYKITWRVTAPRDEPHTVIVNEDNKPVTFNLVLRQPGKNIFLFKNNVTGLADPNTLGLDNGESSGQYYPEVIVDYSIFDFTEACIVWGENRPATLNRGFPFTQWDTSQALGNLCNDIGQAEAVSLNDARAEMGAARETDEGAGIYCGMHGC